MKHFFRFYKLNFLLFRKRAFQNFLSKVNPKTFILISSLLVGILSGFAAAVLKSVVHFFQAESKQLLDTTGIPFIIYLFPLAGIIISVLIVKYFFSGKLSKGLSSLIYNIIRKKSDVPARDIFSHLFTSGATVGMGGSVGLEAPIVVIGASIGSNVSKEFKLNYHHRTLLLACGAAAGISSIFNSPIAGVVFAFEVLLPDMSISSFIPLLLASASSAVFSKLIYSGELIYLATEGWHLYALPYYLLLGIFCGFLSLYMIKINLGIEKKLENTKNTYARILTGGLLLSLIIFFLPPIFGEGYTTITSLLSNNNYGILSNSLFHNFSNPDLALIIFVFLIILLKVVATSLTIGAGGNGGIIAPSLFTGGMLGFWLAFTLRYLGVVTLNQSNFIVVGMAGILAGVLHAPLTGIFLIAEITGGYILIVPLMIVTAISYFISKYFNKYSVYTSALANRGIDFRSEKESFSLQDVNLYSLVETDFYKLTPNMKFRDLISKIQHTKRNLFPVVNAEDMLVGIVTLDDIREVMLEKEVYDVLLIYEIMNTTFQTIDITDDINKAIKIFEEKQVWNIAVVNGNKYLGFISKSNLFNKYISLWHKRRQEEI